MDSDTFLELAGLTGEADVRFAVFMSEQATPGFDADRAKRDCLAIIEMQMNDSRFAGDWCWELEPMHSRSGQSEFFTVTESDLTIIRHELPEITFEPGGHEEF
jgi:hypothetical protein